MTTFDERRAILTAEYQRLEDYLHMLSPEAWEHTPAPVTNGPWQGSAAWAEIFLQAYIGG